MKEVLTQTPENTWSNPKHISFIISEIKRHKEVSRVSSVDNNERAANLGVFISAGRDGRATAFDVRWMSESKIIDLAESVQDYYLGAGIMGLYKNWEIIGDFLLTPKEDRQPIERADWDTIECCVGGLCLAARASSTDVAAEFNLVALTATPETLPRDLHVQYSEAIDAIREAAQA